MEYELNKEPPYLIPIDFRLVNGHQVRVRAGTFWEKISESDRRNGYQPKLYHAIRVYSSEGTLPLRLIQQHEFLPDHDYKFSVLAGIWGWLAEHVASAECREHDDLDDFLEGFADAMTHISNLDVDAVEHYHRLPEISDPDAFDRMDDSCFNDQNEPDILR